MALLSMRNVSIGFGGALVLEQISLQIERGERLGLLGRNGVGKSTLLKIIADELAPDAGDIVRQQGLRVAYLTQEVPQGLAGAVAEVVAGGLERAASDDASDEAWRRRLRLDTTLARMQIDPAADFGQLSAGLQRRVLWRAAWCVTPTLCSSMSPPTTWTPTLSHGWKRTCCATPAP